ncbi:MAG: hypothetical protein K2J37_01375 [Ruminococcus sp.]|nr:hypothetical protein [Ruminococcus sp.]
MEKFLDDMKSLLKQSGRFKFHEDGPKDKRGTEYSNRACMIELEFDKNDVKENIMSLTVENYVETKLYNPEKICYVFCKEIKINQVYIKLFIKSNKNGKNVVCVSFHFVEHPIIYFPYAKKK